MRSIIILAAFFLFLPFGKMSAQDTEIYASALRHHKKGMELFSKGVYGAAQMEFQKAINYVQPANEPEYGRLLAEAKLKYAQAAVYLGQPESEVLMLDFIRSLDPDPLASQALLELGNFYYNQGDYDKAMRYYNDMDASELSPEERAELQFKQGYALFVQKKFSQAASKFSGVRNIQNDYYYPTHYYYGMSQYFLENYDEALGSFKTVQNTGKYQKQVPYYIAQIYFSQGNYDQVISYTEPLVQAGEVRKQKELRQLLGQSYFEKGNYAEAVPHLRYYEQRSARLRSEDFYQLAYSLYQTQAYKEAIPSFQQLTKLDSEMGQNAAYYLGDCFMKTGEKNSARSAFRRVSQLDYNPEMKEEAYFNYAKLSAELGYDREAVNALTSFKSDSPYYTEAQSIMTGLFVETGDYARALEIMDGLEYKSREIKEAYQKVALYRGMQLMSQQRWAAAESMFQKSLEYPLDAAFSSQAVYWQADIAHRQSAYDKSKRLLERYFDMGGNDDNPPESSDYMAEYTQGYNFFKTKKYKQAEPFFTRAISGIQGDYQLSDPIIKNRIVADAYIKKGDCLFKQNDYDKAVRSYDAAIALSQVNVDYAKLQKAVILGLQDKDFEKIVLLEEIYKGNENSQFADDALYELGVTYQGMGKFAQASNALKMLVDNYSERSDLIVNALLQLGLLSYNQGAVNEALGYYERVFDYNPNANQTEGALAAIREIYIEDLGDSEGYAEFLESLPGYDLDDLEKDELAYRAAEVKYENGEYQAAITAYTKYLQKYPQGLYHIVAHFRRGDSYTFEKEYKKALQDFEFVADKGQSDYYEKSVRNAALINYNNEEDFAEALKYYKKWEQVAVSEEDKFEAQLGALRSAYRIDDDAETLRLAQLVAENPRASQSQRLTARFYQAKLSYDNNDLNTALSAFREVAAEENTVRTAESRFRIAQILYAQGKKEEAQEAVMDANKNNSAYPYWIAKGLLLLSDIYADNGQYTDARAAIEAVIDNFKDDQNLLAEAEQKLEDLKKLEENNSRIDDGNPGGNQLMMDTTNNQ